MICIQPTSPNHALQRTAPCVTAPASTTAFPPAMQVPRRPPPSLSLGSLGVAPRLVSNHASLRVYCGPIIPCRPHALAHSSLTSSPSTAFWRHPGFTSSPSLIFSVPVTSPVSTDRRLWSFLSPMRSADSLFWPVVVWAVFPNNATPNHALQRTAPRVTVAAISSSGVSRPSDLFP